MEIANEFKAEFTKYQQEMKVLLSGGDAKEGGKEAAELASALESLDVKPAATEEAPATEAAPVSAEGAAPADAAADATTEK